MNLALFALGTLTGLLTQYSHQTNLVADSTYPVTPPTAKVSVVVCAYNEESFIERTLQDIRSQNIIGQYPEMFEVIVVDNESTDNTVEIASQYADLVITAPRGKLNAKQRGIEVASGEIIVFLDADCVIGSNLLNLLLSHFRSPEVVAVSGGMFLLGNDIGYTIVNIYGNQINSILKRLMIGGVSAVRKEAFYAVGGFRTDVDQFDRAAVAGEEEYGLMQKLRQYGQVVIDDRANVFVESRYQYCAVHGERCATATEPECQYCREMAARQRF
jgi:glycosyltransferase involved in cell wall biosynthesis